MLCSLPGPSDTLAAIEELILVVCTGNTCRSPMAAALLGHHLAARGAPLRVESAGTLGWSGRPATPSAVAAVADRGVELQHHRSRSLRDAADDLRAASLVLAMTRVHAGAVMAHAPELAPRTFLPGELVRLGAPREPTSSVAAWAEAAAAARNGHRVVGKATEEIDDPAGHPFDVYSATAARLDALMSTIAERLAPG
jgi:protein-tyrosine phosphatase